MGGEKIPDYITSEDQEPLGFMAAKRKAKFGDSHYHPEYDEMVYNLLANSDEARTKSHICSLLQVSKPTLLAWMKENPSFNSAVVEGLRKGEQVWRKKIAEHAWKPSKDVNNGLIKLLSANVYGIRDDSEANVVINQNVNVEPEKLMEQRGIPIPEIGVDDIPDEDE